MSSLLEPSKEINAEKGMIGLYLWSDGQVHFLIEVIRKKFGQRYLIQAKLVRDESGYVSTKVYQCWNEKFLGLTSVETVKSRFIGRFSRTKIKEMLNVVCEPPVGQNGGFEGYALGMLKNLNIEPKDKVLREISISDRPPTGVIYNYTMCAFYNGPNSRSEVRSSAEHGLPATALQTTEWSNREKFTQENVTFQKPETLNSNDRLPQTRGTIIPTPYEYALMSQAIYTDGLDAIGDTPGGVILRGKGWRLIEFISTESHYVAGIWIHEGQKQIVIAHRGSKSIESWVTDLETVYRNQVGNFTVNAITILKHPEILSYRGRGYQLSTTGHSLGGFLAQVCLYFSNRDDSPETYFPDMSAYVFDSPGAYDFLQVIGSNLATQAARVNLNKLNIHNFCAEPTVVSTYGKQVGTLWHVCDPRKAKISFEFVNAHRMEHIVSRFDAETGYPKKGIQMADWPKADYSDVDLSTLSAGTLANEALWYSFDAVNLLYKNTIRRAVGYSPETPSWYDQVRKHPGQVQTYLTAKDLETDCAAIIKSHYKRRNSISFPMFHFSISIQRLLVGIIESTAGEIGRVSGYWDNFRPEEMGGDVELLKDFDLVEHGEITALELHSDCQLDIFDFQQRLVAFLGDARTRDLVFRKIKALQPSQATALHPREYVEYISSAVAKAEHGLAFKVTSQSEREAAAREIDSRIAMAVKLKKEGYDKVSLYHSCAVANEALGVAIHMSDDVKSGPAYDMLERTRRDAQSASALAAQPRLFVLGGASNVGSASAGAQPHVPGTSPQ